MRRACSASSSLSQKDARQHLLEDSPHPSTSYVFIYVCVFVSPLDRASTEQGLGLFIFVFLVTMCFIAPSVHLVSACSMHESLLC